MGSWVVWAPVGFTVTNAGSVGATVTWGFPARWSHGGDGNAESQFGK